MLSIWAAANLRYRSQSSLSICQITMLIFERLSRIRKVNSMQRLLVSTDIKPILIINILARR